MFTGIIEAVGKAGTVSKDRLEVSVPADWSLAVGESVAVNGACLTVISCVKNLAAFNLSSETFKRTALGSLKKGSPANLERAVKAGGRFSGHFVTGHVDGAIRLLGIRKDADGFILLFGAPPSGSLLVEKGSAALNGVSLTVFAVSEAGFKTAVIPHTWENTNLKHLRTGDLLNIEYDILGKYVLKTAGNKITKVWLSENGF
ncbi:MAG: riboflavin synthase [Elusimicrobiales bacterium]